MKREKTAEIINYKTHWKYKQNRKTAGSWLRKNKGRNEKGNKPIRKIKMIKPHMEY